jgi:hypothetical protein
MTSSTPVRILGAALLLAVVAIAALAAIGRPVPDVLELLASSTLAGLLGLLAPTPHNGEPQRVDATLRVDGEL